MNKKNTYALALCLLVGGIQTADATEKNKEVRLTTNDYCMFEGNCAAKDGSFASRCLTGITMSGSDGDKITISSIQKSGGKEPVYYDRTDKYLVAGAGAVITPSVVWNGKWMHGYMFVDYNNDGAFSQILSATTKPAVGDEVVSFSYYKGVNSLGVTSNEGAGVSTTAMPTFTLPSNIKNGDYRVRFMIDYNSLNPCGTPETAQNVGCIVDFTLRVGTPIKRYEITIENKMGDYQVAWEDNFDGESFNENTWTRIPPVTYTPVPDWCKYISTHDALFGMDNGELILRGINNTGVVEGDDRPYLCGGVYSMDKKSFEGGRLDIRAKVTSARGAWPAIWLMPSEGGSWPLNGEIDIMEHLNYDTGAYQTVHSWYTLNVPGGGNYPPKHSYTGIDKDGWNTYSVEMLKDTVKFYINNKQTLAYPNIGIENQFPFYRPYYLLLDMQLGGSWVGAVDITTLPVEMRIDYVRHYKKPKIGGLISVTDASGQPIDLTNGILDGTAICVKVTPDEGNTLKALYVGGIDVILQYDASNGYTFNISKDVVIRADYEIPGTSIPNEEVKVKNHADVSYNDVTVKCDSGTKVTIYTIDGRQIAKSLVNNTHTFTLPSGNYIVKMGKDVQKIVIR